MTTPTRFRKDSGKITLIEMIMFPIFILLVTASVRWAVNRYGWIGGISRWIFLFILFPLVPFAFGLLVSAVYSGIPTYPARLPGNCPPSHYPLPSVDIVSFCSF